MIILASNSPRRKELLSMLGYDFEVKPSDCDESSDISEPEQLVKELAYRKAKSTALKCDKNDLVIGSDTVVALDGKILGKPQNKDEAAKMLCLLSGKVHTVYTGLSIIYKDKLIKETVSCDVCFRTLNQKEIADYIATGEPMDKAGAYAIQGKGASFIPWIKGDYYSVVGLPCCRLKEILTNFGF